MALGADPTPFLDDEEDDLLVWVKILKRAEEINEDRWEAIITALGAGMAGQVVTSLFS